MIRSTAARFKEQPLRHVVRSTFVRYGIVGSSAALLQLSLLTVFVELLGMAPVVASTIALAIAIAFNYYFQRRITFRSNAKHHIAGPLFIVITLCTLSANAILFGTLLSWHVPYLPAQVMTLGIIFPINYNLNKRITFRRWGNQNSPP